MGSLANNLNIKPTNLTAIIGTGAAFSNLSYSNLGGTSNLVSRNGSGNTTSNNWISAYTTTATAASTTTLSVTSTQQQYFTGSTTQTVVLPVTSTLVLGMTFTIVNNSSGVVTVQSSGANTIQAMAANTIMTVTVILTSGSTAASWNKEYANQTILTSGFTTIGDATIGVSSSAFTGTNGSVITGINGSIGLTLTTPNAGGFAATVLMTPGNAGTNFAGGGAQVLGGLGGGGGAVAGPAILQGGNGNSGGGGDAQVLGGLGYSGSAGGKVIIAGGAAIGTNVNANTTTITACTGTGTGAEGHIEFQGGVLSISSGTTAHAVIDRMVLNGQVTSLSSGSASNVAQVFSVSNSIAGGFIAYTIEANNGTNYQSTSGQVSFAITNIAGTVTGTASIIGAEVTQCSLGTLVSTWSVDSSRFIKVTPVCVGITPTTFRITFTIFNHSQIDIVVL